MAAGLRANCGVLVTSVKDFPKHSVAAYDIEIVHPDQFLLDQLDLYPGPTMGVLRQLIADYSTPESGAGRVGVTHRTAASATSSKSTAMGWHRSSS